MSNLVGEILSGRYRVDSFLGRGGMAEVYKVWDNQRMVYLAMKVLHQDMAEDRVFLRRFQREAQTLEKLQHPNIVRFHGLEREGRTTFMLMEYIEGVSLRTAIFDASSALSLGRIKGVMRSVCGALYYAHKLGMVHCDIKPANIMLDKYGEVRLTDFGIARVTDGATATLVGAGTPAYMSPEQILGRNPVPQTDVYALGIVLFEMLTGGERPFTGDQAQATGGTGEKVRWEHLNLSPPSTRRWNPSVSPVLDAVVQKCLQKRPEDRYANALELLNAFELATEKVAIERIIPPPPPKRKTPAKKPADASRQTRLPMPAWGIGIVGALLMAFMLIFMVMYNQSKTLRDPFVERPMVIVPTETDSAPMVVVRSTATPYLQPTIEQIEPPTYTPYPTYTPFPTIPPATPTDDARANVENFIVAYWKLVSNKDFSTAYEYQSVAFRNKYNPGGPEGFAKDMQYTERVVVSDASAVSVSSNAATVDADVVFYSTAGTTSTKHHRYTLIVERGHWVIDSASNR